MIFEKITLPVRAKIVGILIILAYSMLTYDITKIKSLGFITDIASGLAVIGIAILMYPVFRKTQKTYLNNLYVLSKAIEGLLMIGGSVCIVLPYLNDYRALIYANVQIYFFIAGALFFYLLLFFSHTVPKFISIWGFIATVILLCITVLKLFGISNNVLNSFLILMILNEFFLALWLIIKGFSKSVL